MNKRSQLFSRAVNYLKGHRPAVSESKVRRKGLAKQYKAAPRFRQRVGIRQRMLALGPRVGPRAKSSREQPLTRRVTVARATASG